MAADIDLQMIAFLVFFGAATLLVALTKRRRRRYPLSGRCRTCGQSLAGGKDRGGLCMDCYRLSRI